MIAHQTKRASSTCHPIRGSQRGCNSEIKVTEKCDFRFDSSVGRGDLITPIGVGRVIRGTSTFSPASKVPIISPCALHARSLPHRDVHIDALTLLHRLG
jgi:hypothetical protein